MITLLSIQKVRDGSENSYLEVQRNLWDIAIKTEPGLIRYEHYRGQEPGQFISLLTFADYDSLMAHQTAPEHTGIDWDGLFCEHEVQVLDPIPGANELQQTKLQSVPERASSLEKEYGAMFPPARPDWWGTIEE